VIKRVRRRRIRLRERRMSRLILKLKLRYKLPAEAYFIQVQNYCTTERERIIVGIRTISDWKQ
jgi:hypothetical protein